MNGIRISQWSEITWIMVDQIKWTDESLSRVDSSVHLIYHDPSDLGSLILIRIIPKERTVTQTSRFLIYYILYHFRKMVHNVFSIGSEYNYGKFHSSDLDLRLANFKICLKMLSEWSRFVWSHCKRKKGKGTSCWIYFFSSWSLKDKDYY